MANIPVGTIITSMLPWEAFKRAVGPQHRDWLPCDRREVDAKTKYYQLVGSGGALHLPDLRGRFLRGLNAFSADVGAISGDLGNPDSRDASGNEFEAGSLQMDTVGPHTHPIPTRLGNIPNNTHVKTSADHEHPDVSTAPNEGTSETRPRNVSVYVYVRVD